MQAAILAALHQGNDIGTRQLVLLKEISEALRGGSIQAAKKVRPRFHPASPSFPGQHRSRRSACR